MISHHITFELVLIPFGFSEVKHVGVAVANIRDLGKVVPTLQD